MENILLYLVIGIILLLVTLITVIYNLSKKLKQLTLGKNGKTLEKVIIENNNTTKEIAEKVKSHSKEINILKERINKTIQNVSVIRFDALKNSGGMQSFAVALTDNHKNGVVISSMYTRDHTNVFAKEIVNGESKNILTEEERKAIN